MAPAFDAVRPPDRSVVADCVHCGFCLPTCPTYVLWGEEMDSPRGRIQLIGRGLEEAGGMSPAMGRHLDRCLGCMACVTSCPSGVRYDRLIEAARPQVERNLPRPRAERAFRRVLFAVLTNPRRLRMAASGLAIYRRTGLRAAVRGSGVLSRFPRLAALERTAPVRLRRPGAPLPAVTPARGPRRGRVALLQGCVQRTFFARVNRATVAVLAAEGFEVHAPALPDCCGALPLHAGEEATAIALAKTAVAALEGFDAVVVNAAGCGSAMKEYGRLLADEAGWAARAERFAATVKDVSEVLAAVPPVAPRGRLDLTIAYHDACHLAHAQGIRAEPRDLLAGIPGLRLVEPAEWELCCGSAGAYGILQPEASAQLGRRKTANLLATGASAVAAGNPGCALQIEAFAAEQGRTLPVYHPVELLWASIRAPRGR